MTNMASTFSNCGEKVEFKDTGGGGSMSPIQIKLSYESNPDTNAFTDALKLKLENIDEGAANLDFQGGFLSDTNIEETFDGGTL